MGIGEFLRIFKIMVAGNIVDNNAKYIKEKYNG